VIACTMHEVATGDRGVKIVPAWQSALWLMAAAGPRIANSRPVATRLRRTANSPRLLARRVRSARRPGRSPIRLVLEDLSQLGLSRFAG
jgi:hypothetical protein